MTTLCQLLGRESIRGIQRWRVFDSRAGAPLDAESPLGRDADARRRPCESASVAVLV